jgi:uncharacterized protein (DUF1499 family)
LLVIGAVLAALIALRVVAAAIWPTINDVTTGATPEYPDLQPQQFAKPADQVFAAALATAREMEFEITSQSPEKGEIQAVATTKVFRFKDDVSISVTRKGAATAVYVRSHSRIGKGDLGANARRIREFQARLAEKVQSLSSAPAPSSK